MKNSVIGSCLFFLVGVAAVANTDGRVGLNTEAAIDFNNLHEEWTGEEPNCVPVTGANAVNVKLLDEVMLKYRKKIGCSAATLAISKQGRIMYRRGYGWIDMERTIPTGPDTLIGIASCGKSMCAASIRQLAKERRLDLNGKVFEMLAIKPQGPIRDERVKDITINHVLAHMGGWGADPGWAAMERARKAGFKDPIAMETILGFIMTEPLEDEPGTKAKYSNFGYEVLRHIVEKTSGKSWIEYMCKDLMGMPVVKEMSIKGELRSKDDVLVWNADDGGLNASARLCCRYMEKYWLTGELRQGNGFCWNIYGSLGGSTAMMIWRADGTNIAAIFNGRADVSHGEIQNELETALSTILQLTIKGASFKGGWKKFGPLQCSNLAGDSIDFVFDGTSVTWLGKRFDDAGQVKVEIDEKEIAKVDQYGPIRDKPFRWNFKDLQRGQHKMRITILSSTNSRSKGNWINVETFLVE
ncbi:MAG: hypothetical protein A2Y07_09325 [Planctomycetes bacterium GWF2_50_10]|nr:MAG: hypothetical protein A2Y07_09325 [Planctomycetes bacterium GWF2_50_10]